MARATEVAAVTEIETETEKKTVDPAAVAAPIVKGTRCLACSFCFPFNDVLKWKQARVVPVSLSLSLSLYFSLIFSSLSVCLAV